METKHAIITAAAVIAAGFIGGITIHGLLNRYEIISTAGEHESGYRLDKVTGETVSLDGEHGEIVTPAHPTTKESESH